MNREQSLRVITSSITRFQEEIADMLGAKATETEKARNWITLHMMPHTMEDHADRMKQALEIHELAIEVIEGMTKLETALGTHMKLLIGASEKDGGAGGGQGELGGGGSLGGLFGGMGGK